MRISDWSSDVCSSDLGLRGGLEPAKAHEDNAASHVPAGGPQMDWDNLKVALAISRTGSLTKAAQMLGIDQSTAGRRLSALEGDLGIILFVRSKTGFALTAAGEAAIGPAVEVERRHERLTEAVLPPTAGPAGIVPPPGHPRTPARPH